MTDTQQANPTEANEAKSRTNKSRALLAIITVSVLPIFAAYFMFFTGIGVPDNTVNQGFLLPNAVNIDDLLGDEHETFATELNTEKKWRLLLPLGQECNSACEQNFYTTRQVHIRLSEKSIRLERVAVNIGGTVGLRLYDQLSPQHPKLKLLTVNVEQWQNWLNASGEQLHADQRPYYLLLDQEGFAMMYYTEEHHGNALLKDIKRALKYSIDYQ